MASKASSSIQHVFFFLFLVVSSLSSLSAKSFPNNLTPRFPGRSSRSHRLQSPVNKYLYETHYFEQQLDHFSFSNLPTFRQRYLISTQHWLGPNRMGPIFFYCGNEGDIEWFADNTGFVWELAPRFGAMVVFPEHRYYGESFPYGSIEEAYKNATTLSYLTTEQALADFAILITDLKRNLSAEASPVVLFGGSYGGMLAAWMRLKYPHLAIGALASSAPVLQFEDIVPPETFYNIVSNGFRQESSSCFKTIKESWDVIESESEKNDGLLKLTKTFHMCQKLETVEDLFNWLESAYSYLAMVNYPYPSSFMTPLPGNPIKELCRRIDNNADGTTILERIYEGVNMYYNYTGEVDCFMLDDDPHGLDGWDWQACTEMVMPMSSSLDISMFPTYDYNYTSYQEYCSDSFNVKSRPTWITTEFGGHDFKTALKYFGTNIIFSNGLLDPWSGGSVLEDISESIVALVTEKGAHHLDLRPATDEDPDWLVEQRETEIKLIKGWLDSYNQEKKAHFSS
ncbi:lysosomal Pro-X carboxypeptidase-like [Impatiens glandulifera]|uniref:lysosomal Pro-X carboxypeptidase-like n=1 Tax=Impatiens glandulifera TaxID=253017 RepID=UPI001FB0CDC8|nr:lysosomal Pro-X carboxypeptidase-like [Impatiens glandulifera]